MPPKKETKAKKAGEKKGVTTRISKWYKADDERVHFHRRQKVPKAANLRHGVAPGQVLILLAGRFRGKRVVFLKQLKSGLLLVTGPFKVNGVPLKRVNQAYVIPTKTTVDIKNVPVNDVDDAYFAKTKAKKLKKSEETFFATSPEKSQEEKAKETERKKEKFAKQVNVDKSLLENIKKVPLLKKYLGARFTLTNRMRPHELVF